MPRVAFIFRTDVHVAEKGPASWKGDYAAEIFSNLEQVGELARKHQATAVLDGGDYFHVKAPTRNPHSIVVRSAEIHAAYPCPTYCVEGNHDIAYNNLASIDRQPLGVLYASGVFHHLRDEVFVSNPTRHEKLNDIETTLTVRVVGVPYDPNQQLETIRAIQKQPGDDYLIAVIHALAAESPPAHVDDFFGEPVFRYSDLITENGPDVFCFGHWHKDQGVVEIEGRRFINQGALSRGALVKENLSRTPQAALIELTPEGITIGTIPMQVAPAEDVFDLERKERRDEESRVIDEFVTRIQEDVAIDVADDIETTVETLDFAPEVQKLAKEYLERARGG